MIKVLSIFGTRPEAIKMAPLVIELEKNKNIESKVCVTAQHREMLDQVLELFKITPNHDLNIMSHGQSIIDIISKSMYGLDEIIKKESPDLVLVHGDTSTTYVGAYCAFLNKVPVGHVEAGLRSGNIYSPFPEEMNRKLTSSIAELHFAPTEGNRDNLLREGIDSNKIFITGNTVIDALLGVIRADYTFEEDILNKLDYENKKIISLTCHRRENWGKPMENIFNAINDVVIKNPEVELVFPIHKNPEIRALAKKLLGNNSRIHIIEPLDYEPFANLMSKSYLILTDSGGIQEEAPSLGKPVVVMRTETERPEAVKAGTVKIAGVERDDVFNIINSLINDKNEYSKMANATNPYGDGLTSKRIIEIIENYFNR